MDFRRFKQQWIALAALVGFAAGLLPPATAFSAALNKYAVAVIIGNKDYKDRIPDVDFALNDADDFKSFVIDVLGYDPDNVIDLRNATQADLQAAFGNRQTHEGKLWRYIDPKGKSDVTVFYSGHGVPGLKDQRGYLLPVDADPNAPEINGYPVDVLFANLAKLDVKSMSVFLDACFSGDSQQGMLVRATSGITIAPKMPSQPTSRMTVITAAQGDQVASWDFKAKRGMFTKHLMDALYGQADREEYSNADGKVTMAEVRDYLDDRMTRAARREYGRHQNAWVKGSDDTVLVAALPTKRRPAAVAKPAPVKPKPAPKPVQQARVTPQPAPKPAPPKKPPVDKWIMEISGPDANENGMCMSPPAEFTVIVHDGKLISPDNPFPHFEGRVRGAGSDKRVIGSMTIGYMLVQFELRYRNGAWTGPWDGNNHKCGGDVAMRR